MDFIDGLDVELDKDFYYPGETISGCVLLSCLANVKIRGITVTLRGRVQVQWKVVRNGVVYTVRNCHIIMDHKQIVFGQVSGSEFSSELPVLTKGTHKIPFSFPIKDDAELPSSFESRLGTIRYFLHTCVDIPYASPPQNVKYFSMIGRQQESPPQEWLVPITLERRNQALCMACSHGSLSFEVALERTAFCCGELIPVRLEICNGINLKVWPNIQLIQKVDFCVDKTGFGIRKDAVHVVWEYKGLTVPKHSTMKLENLSQVLQVPVMPPTTCTSTNDIIRIEYKLKVSIQTLKWGEPLHVTIPILITPYYNREDNTRTILKPAIHTVEGGNYVSPELQSGGVYGCTEGEPETTYQPMYVCVPHKKVVMKTPSTPDIKRHKLQADSNKRTVSMPEIEVSEGRVSSL